MTSHHFDIDLASCVGINAAIIFENIRFWVAKNEANQSNYFDGEYWTYNSVRAFQKLFPYLSKRKISCALEKLRQEQFILVSKYNTAAYDRTKWYTIGAVGREFIELTKCNFDVTKAPYRSDSSVTPIPVNKPVNKPDINGQESPDGLFDKFWSVYPKKQAKKDARKIFAKINPDQQLLDKIIQNIHARIESGDWSEKNRQYIPQPGKYLSSERWEDELGESNKPQEFIL